MDLEKKIYSQFLKNFDYSINHGYTGYDPQLFWHLTFYRLYSKKKNIFLKILRRIESEILASFPFFIIPYAKICGIEKELSPYGLGLFLRANSLFYKISQDKKFLKESNNIFNILNNLKIKIEHGFGFGNAKTKFNEKKFFFNTIVSNETSFLVVVSEVIFGLIEYYKISKNIDCFEMIKKISNAILYDYNFRQLTDSSGVFDYSSAKDYTHILNSNALATKALIEAQDIGAIQLDSSKILMNLNYIRPYLYQKDIPYAGVEDQNLNSNRCSCDLYHTGFTLRGTLKIAEYLNDLELASHIKKKMLETLHSFLNQDDYILMFKKKNLMEIYSFSEYIRIYCSIFDSISEEDKVKFFNIILKNLKIFDNLHGTYFYKIYSGKKIDIYFPRWSHASMMDALAVMEATLSRG